MNILILGQHTSITNTVEEMLATVCGWTVTKNDSLDNATAYVTTSPDLIVANLADFAETPTEVVGKIKKPFSTIPLLVLYSYSQELLINPLLEAGATGYLQFGAPEKELFETIKTVAAGNYYVGTESTY